ncbi:MAG: hypothetical protein ACREQ5_14680, partial [Candidatus Dormibacteria bacterium]
MTERASFERPFAQSTDASSHILGQASTRPLPIALGLLSTLACGDGSLSGLALKQFLLTLN